MIYLVDSNVLSEPTRPSPDAKALNWLSANEGDLVVDSIVLGEMRLGILSLPRGRKRSQLEEWSEGVRKAIVCVPWDAAVGLRWAELAAELRRKGQPMPFADSMIAATALTHGFTVATRNVRDFRQAGVRVVDPFA